MSLTKRQVLDSPGHPESRPLPHYWEYETVGNTSAMAVSRDLRYSCHITAPSQAAYRSDDLRMKLTRIITEGRRISPDMPFSTFRNLERQ